VHDVNPQKLPAWDNMMLVTFWPTARFYPWLFICNFTV